MRPILLASLLALWLVACSDKDTTSRSSSPTPTPTPSQIPEPSHPFVTPPSAYLTDRSGKPVEGRTGTYCWQLGQRGLCVDHSPWITNNQPIPIDPGKSLVLVFDAGTPRDTRVRWLPTAGLTSRDHGDVLDWTPTNCQPAQLTTDLRAPTQPGRYALAVLTYFPEGDVTYGFYVEVR